ncbi:MAG TPA: BON domain-containing protein [Vicinamibacterales bacterium]|nr:BON domain-containing protein [Vicinamibacterales bacterium]
MFRALFKLVLFLVVVAIAGAFLLGWWGTGRVFNANAPADPVVTSDATRERAKAAGDAIGDRTAQAAEKTGEIAKVAGNRAAQAAEATRQAIGEGSMTAKIKAKMALDDHVKALGLDVDTVGTIVTVSGSVTTEAERDRALALARDTQGVTQVVDRIVIKK